MDHGVFFCSFSAMVKTARLLLTCCCCFCCKQDYLVRAAVPGMAVSEAASRVHHLAGWQRNEAVADSHPGFPRR